MAKYITLDGLGGFLTKLKEKTNFTIFGKPIWTTSNNKGININNSLNLIDDSTNSGYSTLEVKLDPNGGLSVTENGLKATANTLTLNGVNMGYNLRGENAIGPTLVNEYTLGSADSSASFDLKPHQMCYLDTELATDGENTSLSSINITQFGSSNSTNPLGNTAQPKHAVQYYLHINIGSGVPDCSLNYPSVSTPTLAKPKIFWMGTSLTTLTQNNVYEIIFTRPVRDSKYLTAAWSKFSK